MFSILGAARAAANVSVASGGGVTALPSPPPPPPTADVVADRVRGAILGMAIGDALSMPVHWYYNPADITRDFGRIVDFQAPKERHPSSILSLSSTGGAGRGGQAGSIIGDVINHGKKQFWGVPGTHYHRGMRAGENTLNLLVARVLVRTMNAGAGGVVVPPAAFLDAYVRFMTTPGSHNDTYAETYHRMFFKNYVAGRPPARCADDDGHNVASMGGFVLLPPPALAAAAAAPGPDGRASPATLAAAADAAAAQMYATHNSPALERHARLYAALLARVLYGEDLRSAAAATARALGRDVAAWARDARGDDTRVIGGTVSSACYIDDAFPALLYLAHKYADDPEAALVANTNAGGENAHRGAALGALLGAARGARAWPARWTEGLADGRAIDDEARRLAEGAAAAYARGVAAGAGAAANGGAAR